MDLLYESVYGHQRSQGFFSDKYNTAYTGAKYIGYLAYDPKHQPIAFYGVIPTLVWYNGKTILAAQSADTMTHPGYRNMGLFTDLANLTYALCKQVGIRFVFGFPNQNSLPGFVNKLDWQITETLHLFKIPVKGSIPLEQIALKFSPFKAVYNHYINWVLKGNLTIQKGVRNSVFGGDYNGIFRDDEYLKYKSYSPTRVIEIDGTLFWIKLQNGLQIGDIENIGDNFENVINKLKALARKLGLTQIQFQTSPQIRLDKLFAAHYQPIDSFKTGFKIIDDDINIETIKFTLADIDIF
ncbi:MAG: GNAT family N-acetyltransferase [Bacteroidota bacterium]